MIPSSMNNTRSETSFRKAHLMGYDHSGESRCHQLFDNSQNFPDHLRVRAEVGSSKSITSVPWRGADDGGAALTAGQLCRADIPPFIQADAFLKTLRP